MPLPKFPDENTFRQQWIKPFLQKLGYILVTHSHGSSEHGKDLFFADFDRFEHPRFCSVQAKNGDIKAGTGELTQLMEQVEASFTVRIRDRRGAEEKRVSAVYIMASGRISDQARTRITDYCRSKPYGENVYFLDGDRLETLEQFATYREDQKARSVLLALKGEIERTMVQLEYLATTVPGSVIPHRFCTSAVECLLAGSILSDAELYKQAQGTWSLLAAVNQTIDFFNLCPPSDRAQAAFQVNVIKAAQLGSEQLSALVKKALAQLDERYALTIDVVSGTAP